MDVGFSVGRLSRGCLSTKLGLVPQAIATRRWDSQNSDFAPEGHQITTAVQIRDSYLFWPSRGVATDSSQGRSAFCEPLDFGMHKRAPAGAKESFLSPLPGLFHFQFLPRGSLCSPRATIFRCSAAQGTCFFQNAFYIYKFNDINSAFCFFQLIWTSLSDNSRGRATPPATLD